jgi:hypothetical protein
MNSDSVVRAVIRQQALAQSAALAAEGDAADDDAYPMSDVGSWLPENAKTVILAALKGFGGVGVPGEQVQRPDVIAVISEALKENRATWNTACRHFQAYPRLAGGGDRVWNNVVMLTISTALFNSSGALGHQKSCIQLAGKGREDQTKLLDIAIGEDLACKAVYAKRWAEARTAAEKADLDFEDGRTFSKGDNDPEFDPFALSDAGWQSLSGQLTAVTSVTHPYATVARMTALEAVLRGDGQWSAKKRARDAGDEQKKSASVKRIREAQDVKESKLVVVISSDEESSSNN